MTTPINLTHCTLTGVDERTDLDQITELSRDYPIAEWGFLYSPKRQGQPGRYPSVDFLMEAFRTLPPNVRVALHVCGQGVHDLLSEERVVTQLVMMVAIRGGRIQLNFNQKKDAVNLWALNELMHTYPAMKIITQFNEANTELWREFRQHPSHSVLFDASSGRGIKSDTYPEMLPIPCGYAGGLSMDNLHKSLEELATVTGQRSFWVDMEGSLRIKDDEGNDWFDLIRCEACLEIAQAHVPKKVDVPSDEGWWVPVDQYFVQKVLPRTGAWQKVRCFTGVAMNACVLAGQDGWVDGNYNQVSGVREWLKPTRWFRWPDDMEGNVEAMIAYKKSLPKSPLRGSVAASDFNMTTLVAVARGRYEGDYPTVASYIQEAKNVQEALRQCGFEVSVSDAAAVWEDYSDSLAASWMAGAETVEGAKGILEAYCLSMNEEAP